MTSIMPDASSLAPLRSVLIAPAVRPDFVAKLPSRGADLLFLDCEDAVPPSAKAEARALALASVPALVEAGCRVVVRCNPVDSEWFADDIAKGIAVETTAVVVPKIERIEDLEEATATLAANDLADTGIIAGIETALGVADARDLLGHQQVVAAYFGAEDFIADMGGVRTESNAEVAMARAYVALAGRLAKVAVIDQVVTGFGDDGRFTREAMEARNLGYDGKLCIHPRQVELANASFSPSAEEVDRAERLLAAYQKSQARGLAAIDFEGQMVDEPLAAQARRLLSRAGRLGHDIGRLDGVND